MHKELEQFKDFLESKGLKNTRGRKIILRELEARKNHFNAEDLYSSLTRKGTRVSRPTIYRTLKLLERFRLIERFDIKKNCFYYEPISQKKNHGHLICEQCGKIIDFSSNGAELLKSEVGRDKDFKLDNISIQVFGVCRDCQKASKNKN
ncbi:MAG: Fur family transcriptional regulator [Thermodesulfobacteriota bacterium]